VTTQPLVPFVLGHGAGARALVARCPVPGCVFIDVLDDDSAAFFRLLGAGNARAYGGLGMPAWVQLDCATLPSAMIGFARAAADVDSDLVADLAARAGVSVSDHDLVPLAEYCAVPALDPATVVGFSLFAFVPGWGVRAKAMALVMLDAAVQRGVAQLDNSATRTHSALGPLLLHRVGVAVHDRPAFTYIYDLAIDRDRLTRIARGAERPVRAAVHEDDVTLVLDADTPARLRALQADGPVWLVDWQRQRDAVTLRLRRT
jgi:hypothetical protein